MKIETYTTKNLKTPKPQNPIVLKLPFRIKNNVFP